MYVLVIMDVSSFLLPFSIVHEDNTPIWAGDLVVLLKLAVFCEI